IMCASSCLQKLTATFIDLEKLYCYITVMQLDLLSPNQARKLVHGGGKSRSHAKTARPFKSNKWIHLTLKSERAKGHWSFLSAKNKPWLIKLLREKSKKFYITI